MHRYLMNWLHGTAAAPHSLHARQPVSTAGGQKTCAHTAWAQPLADYYLASIPESLHPWRSAYRLSMSMDLYRSLRTHGIVCS